MSSTYTMGNLHRAIVFSNIQLSGVFSYKDVVRCYPLESIEAGYEPLILEYNNSYYPDYPRIRKREEGDDVISQHEEGWRHKDFMKELMALLTLVTGANVFEDMHKESSLNSPNLFGNELNCDATEAHFLSPNKVFKIEPILVDSLVFPSNVYEIMDSYFSLKGDLKNRLRMSLMLFYNSILLNEISPSMAYVALVSTIENLADIEREREGYKATKCKECGQKKYRALYYFRKTTQILVGDSSNEFKKYLETVYEVRSKIAHVSDLMYSDYASAKIDFRSSRSLLTLRFIARIVLNNWLLSESKKDVIQPQLMFR